MPVRTAVASHATVRHWARTFSQLFVVHPAGHALSWRILRTGRCAMRVCLQDLTAEEGSAVETLARSRTEPARRVELARIVWRASRGETPPTIAAALGLDAETVRRRIRRFNQEGLAALEDHPRCGRPATYSPDAVASLIGAALTSPRHLGLPFAAGRSTAYLLEQ